MKTNLLATLFILSILTMTISGTAFAQTVTVGVNPGNILDYNYSLFWNSTDPTATIPPEYIELNNTQLIQINIKSVSGSLINMDITKHFKNGTETTQNGSTDVDTQVIDIPYGFLIIRANANADEKIYPSGGHATITETILRTYAQGTRETNHYISESTTTDTYEKIEIYFDKTTGVAVEYYYELSETSNSYVTTTKETVTLDSSVLWTIPELIQPITPTPSPTPSITPIPSPTPTSTPLPTSTPTPSPTPTPTPTPTPSPTTPEFPQTIMLLVVVTMFLIVTVGLVAHRRHKTHNLAIPK